ncbi:hypothetical protein KI387_000392, partial [Taxus chinensis]
MGVDAMGPKRTNADPNRQKRDRNFGQGTFSTGTNGTKGRVGREKPKRPKAKKKSQ